METTGTTYKRTFITLVCASLLSAAAFAQDNLFSANVGVTLPSDVFYVGDPIDYWPDRDAGLALGAKYYRGLSSTFFLGTYLDYEIINAEDETGSRTGIGICFMGRLPEDLSGGFGFELGATLGLAFVGGDEMDSQFGGDYGVFLGPVIELGNDFQIALHIDLIAGGGTGGEIPESVFYSRSGVRISVYKGF
jgi:hypothetical protein